MNALWDKTGHSAEDLPRQENIPPWYRANQVGFIACMMSGKQ